MSWLSEASGRVRILVKVYPRAARNEVAGVDGDYLRVRLSAPPVNGEANRQLQKFLGEVLRCSPGSVQIVRGATGRIKLLEIAGLGEPDVLRLISLRLPRTGSNDGD